MMSNIEELSADRKLVTPEINMQNDYYGIARVLKSYASLPIEESSYMIIEHGVSFYGKYFDVDQKTLFPVVLVPSTQRASLIKSLHRNKKPLPIGPLIHYAVATLPADLKTTKTTDKKTLIVFPMHSTYHHCADFDMEDFIAGMEKFGENFDDIKICMYWKDIVLDRHLVFQERGYECVTAGHLYDNKFLWRLVTILQSGDAVYTNGVGSHTIYAVSMNIPVLFEHQIREMKAITDYKGAIFATNRDLEHPDILELKRVFGDWHGHITNEQHQLVNRLGGLDCIKTPDEMRDIFNHAVKEHKKAKIKSYFYPRENYQRIRQFTRRRLATIKNRIIKSNRSS